jgi:hypothetical protein
MAVLTERLLPIQQIGAGIVPQAACDTKKRTSHKDWDMKEAREQILSARSQFCFPDGETIHAEGAEADVFPSDEAA